MATRVPVLTYHSMNVSGNDYSGNDHVALASDLETIREAGKRIVPLSRVVDWCEGKQSDSTVADAVALSIDDGSWFDFFDIDHPAWGIQRSMFNIMRDHLRSGSGTSSVHVTSFVIASPEARTSLDRSCMVGKGWWGDEWWAEAAQSGIMEIASHSWDHVHPELPFVAQKEQVKGDFSKIECFEDADAQIAQAGAYIADVLGGRKPELFAYPWGAASEYLVREYLPKYQPKHGLKAAFTIEPRPVSRDDNRWLLPRFVCGRDWDSTAGLRKILEEA